MADDNRKSLVIVESVAKTKTINKFLGKDYLVLSSVGHLVDLPQRKLGVDVENDFAQEYKPIRKKQHVMRELKKAAADAKDIYLATDPDREGEAIAWHLAEILKNKNDRIQRVLFNEITKNAVLRAMEHPLEVDIDKVEAQKARRVMDRLVGYQVSPILWNTLYTGLSAGRVQSVALRLLCEREEEIEAFVPKEYWSITGRFQGRRTEPFESKLLKIKNSKIDISNIDLAKVLVADLRTQTWSVKDIRKREMTKNPLPPFTTSTLQQDAARRLGFTAKRIMIVAQQLYEGIEVGDEGSVGLITYMRTDSTRIADEAVSALREFIIGNYGKEYLPGEPRKFKVKAGAQDAHEAIRPTEVSRTPKSIKKYLNDEQYKLYELIWNRFVACQMQPAKLEQTSIDIVGGEDEMYLFRTTGSVVKFRGYMQVYEDAAKSAAGDEKEAVIPTELSIGEKVTLLDITPNQHFTKPPARFSESSLVRELDKLSIGRPSTYAMIISTIVARNYIERNGQQLIPSELGRTVNRILVSNFPTIFNVEFTANMEERLDEIEAGKRGFVGVMNNFYGPFSKALKAMSSKEDKIRESLIVATDEKCPLCKGNLIIKWGRLGRYKACENNPECKFTKTADKDTGHIVETCELCGREMVVKAGRFGRFIACSGYPECKNSKPFTIGMKCPKAGCEGDVIERKSRRGRLFFGCSRYPNCDFIASSRPIPQKCEICGNNYLEKKYSQAKGEFYKCPQCKQEYAEDMTKMDEAIVEFE